MLTELKTAIKAHITAVTGIENVYGYEKGDLGGYPSAVVLLEGIESDIDSTDSNDRKYTFKVKVYQEISEDATGAEQAEDIMEGLVDAMIERFENDWTLGDLAYKSDIKGVAGYIDRGNAMRVLEFTLQYYTSITIS